MANGRIFALAAPIALRTDLDAETLRRGARRSRDAAQTSRLLALAAIFEGGSRGGAARIGGATLRIVRDWALRFNAERPEGLVDRKAPGAPRRLDDAQRRALVERVENGPIAALRGVVRRRLVDLAQWVRKAFRIPISPQTLSRELRGLGCRKLSAGPRHVEQDSEALEGLENVAAALAEIAEGKHLKSHQRRHPRAGLISRMPPGRPARTGNPTTSEDAANPNRARRRPDRRRGTRPTGLPARADRPSVSLSRGAPYRRG